MGEKIINENQTKMDTKVTNDSGQYLKTNRRQKVKHFKYKKKQRDFSQYIQEKQQIQKKWKEDQSSEIDKYFDL